MSHRGSAGHICIECKERPVLARHMCKRCYYRLYQHGGHVKHPILTSDDAFLSRINKTDSCWLWTGTTNGFGYGILLMPGEIPVRAHRYAFERWVRKLVGDEVVMHSCDNPPCVNPAHLSAGTRTENNRDAVKKRRNAFGIKNGHARLTTQQVEEIKELIGTKTQTKIAKMFGVTQGHICNIRQGYARSKG